MTKRPLLASLLLCLSLSATSTPGLAQTGRAAGDDPIARMERAGWQVAQEGVLRPLQLSAHAPPPLRGG